MLTRPWLALTPIRSTPEGITRAAMGFTRCSATWTAQTEHSTVSSDRATPARTPAQTRPRPSSSRCNSCRRAAWRRRFSCAISQDGKPVMEHQRRRSVLAITGSRRDARTRCSPHDARIPRSVEASGDAPCLEIVSASPHRAASRRGSRVFAWLLSSFVPLLLIRGCWCAVDSGPCPERVCRRLAGSVS